MRFFFFPFLRRQVRHWFPCTSHASAAPASTWAARCLVIFVQDAHHCFLFFFLSSYAFSQTWYTTCYKLFIQVILSVRDARLERSYFKTQVKLLLQILMIPHSNNHIRECLMLLNRFHLTSLIIIGAGDKSMTIVGSRWDYWRTAKQLLYLILNNTHEKILEHP